MKELMKIAILSFSILFLFSFLPLYQTNAQASTIVIIPVHDEVENGLAAFIKRGIQTAEDSGADHIILDMDTPGGVVEAATKIAKTMRETKIPITAFVNKKAISAGSYIALYADKIVMVPGATMGSSAVIDSTGNTAGKKAEAFWLKEMIGAASLNNRDPIYAKAMVDMDVHLPEYDAPKGELLTLTAKQALEVGYAEKIVDNRTELFNFLNIDNPSIIEMKLSFAEQVARIITHPVVIPILLSIGSLGLVLELYTPGFGIPGIMGLASLALFFYGHLVAGLAGMESIILIIVGILAVILELFVPGGILGLIGVCAIIGSLLLATDNISYMIFSILIAFAVTIIGSIIMFKVFGFKGGIFKHIILSDSTSTEKGYVSYDDRTNLIGKKGIAVTTLRPSGTGLFDGERIDVVSEGEYIEKGKQLIVLKVSGVRVVVREIVENED